MNLMRIVQSQGLGNIQKTERSLALYTYFIRRFAFFSFFLLFALLLLSFFLLSVSFSFFLLPVNV